MLLHELGDLHGGALWRAAAPTDWIIPDLPGHGIAPAPRSGHYDPMVPISFARWMLPSEAASTLVGVGEHAHCALVHAAGAGCGRVVIVDGLGGPWLGAREQIDEFYDSLRAIVDDPLASTPPPATGTDPRTRYGYGVNLSSAFVQRFWAIIDQPVLAIETPASTTPLDERAERITWFGGDAKLVELESNEPSAIVAAVLKWCTDF